MKDHTAQYALITAALCALSLPASAQKSETKAKEPSAKPPARNAAKATPAASPRPAASAAPSPAPSPAPPPTPPVTVIIQPPEPPRSDLVSGWVGLALLGVGGFFVWRTLRGRGVTVTGAFRRIGGELAADAPATPAPAPLRPAAAPLPPLPSLSELPPPGPAAAPSPLRKELPPPPRLIGVAGPMQGAAFGLSGRSFTVGREEGCDLALAQDTTLSRRHARFEPHPTQGWQVIDEGSSNGTFVNGQPVSGPQTLAHGDEVQIGGTRLRFEAR